jgi:hypothetical protein
MAGDWIKMRTDLYRDPKVCLIADYLLDEDSDLSRYVNQHMQRDITVTRNVMRNMTVGALVSVWGVLRHRGKRVDNDLIVKYCGVGVIDDLADLPGFGGAMAAVGWVEETEEGIVLPRFFEEFNIDPGEDAKAKNAERQRRHRAKLKEKSNEKSNVTVTLKNNAREEKRREENNKLKVINNNKRAGELAEFDVSRFLPDADDIVACESLSLDAPLEHIVAEFRVYHAETGTVTTAANWSRLLRGWVQRRVMPPAVGGCRDD